jgi:hypothetical protein
MTLILEFYLLVGWIGEVGWANLLRLLKNWVRSRFAVIITWCWGNFYWFLLSFIVSKCGHIIFEFFHTWFFLDCEYFNLIFLILNRSYPFRKILRYFLPSEFFINYRVSINLIINLLGIVANLIWKKLKYVYSILDSSTLFVLSCERLCLALMSFIVFKELFESDFFS